MFYNALNNTVIDYVGGYEDIHQGLLRTIGIPERRFKQDPVRMLRALKFRARFNFSIEKTTEQALIECYQEIGKSAPARLLEEIFRMLESGSAESFFRLMTEYRLLEVLFSSLTSFLQGAFGEEVYSYLAAADKLNNNGTPYSLERPVLAACLLFPIMERELKEQYIEKDLSPHLGDIMMLTSSIIKGALISSFPHFPRRISSSLSFILSMQYRLTPISGKKHYRPSLFNHKEFVFALHFLKIRSCIDPNIADIYYDVKNRYQSLKHLHEPKHHPSPEVKKRRRRRRKPS